MNRSHVRPHIGMRVYEQVPQVRCWCELDQSIKRVYVIVNWLEPFQIGHVDPRKSLNWDNSATEQIENSEIVELDLSKAMEKIVMEFVIVHADFERLDFEGIDSALVDHEKDFWPSKLIKLVVGKSKAVLFELLLNVLIEELFVCRESVIKDEWGHANIDQWRFSGAAHVSFNLWVQISYKD